MTATTATSRPGPVRRRPLVVIERLDWVLIAAALALSVLGCVLVESAGAGMEAPGLGRRQAIALVLAVALAYLLTRVEPRSLRAFAPLGYGLSLVGIVLVFTPLGVDVAGAQAWLRMPMGFTLQPSEFAKPALIVMLAATLATAGAGRSDRNVVRALGLAAAPVLLVLASNDTGTALILAGTTAVVLMVGEVSWRWLAGLGIGAAAVAAAAVATGALADYQVQRLIAFLDPGADPTGFGLNSIQARVAIGSGGLTGQGLFAGPQTQGGFVPVADSDFIFTVVAEEAGLIGGLLLITLVGVVLWRGLRIAFGARDTFGRLVAAGVVAWLALQSFENIGMTLGIMPVTGVTLPFVSYGGSSMIAAWLGIGLLQLVHLSRQPARLL